MLWASRAASGPSGEVRLRWALQSRSLQVRHPSTCSPFNKNQNIQCVSPVVANDLGASSGTIKAEEHPNQTGSPEPWVLCCESAGKVPHQPFCAPEHGSNCCPRKLHKLQQVLASKVLLVLRFRSSSDGER